MRIFFLAVIALGWLDSPGYAQPARSKPYRLSAVDLQQPLLWGAECLEPPGKGLAFGGQHQLSDDGRGHTRRFENGQWRELHPALQAANALEPFHQRALELVEQHGQLLAEMRSLYFAGLTAEETARRLAESLEPRQVALAANVRMLVLELKKLAGERPEAERARWLELLDEFTTEPRGPQLRGPLHADDLTLAHQRLAALQRLAERCAAEPPPRALGPLAYDAATDTYLLFGGDHCDYLTNDTWAFEARAGRWRKLWPGGAPPPRANHALKSLGGGLFELTGGYTYTSSTDYCGGQYRDRSDGSWTFDLAKNAWQSRESLPVESERREYRTGPFDPAFYFAGPLPAAATWSAFLEQLPENEWKKTDPPQRPELNRDWGTAVLDTDRDLILRYSGGHSAHGGTDVLHYHLPTNRWELTSPVEFPLGQLYTNTEYPEGFNFNGRPWITGHTYQNYAYDAASRRMLFTGRHEYTYFYDPRRGDWRGREKKPPGMIYNSCFYTLTLTSTPHGLYCWTGHGDLFHYGGEPRQWRQAPLAGDKLPEAIVDNSTLVYDSGRDRLLCLQKPYGDATRYSGELHAIDRKTSTVRQILPENRGAAAAIPYLCQFRYDAEHSLVLGGCTLPPDADGKRRTPAFDCAADRWISLDLSGDDPSGPKGRNVSLGLMYDAKRRLFWAVDAASEVFVLRLNPARATVKPL